MQKPAVLLAVFESPICSKRSVAMDPATLSIVANPTSAKSQQEARRLNNLSCRQPVAICRFVTGKALSAGARLEAIRPRVWTPGPQVWTLQMPLPSIEGVRDRIPERHLENPSNDEFYCIRLECCNAFEVSTSSPQSSIAGEIGGPLTKAQEVTEAPSSPSQLRDGLWQRATHLPLPIPRRSFSSARRGLDRALGDAAVEVRAVGAAVDALAEGVAGLLGALEGPVGAAVVDVVPDDGADLAVVVAHLVEHVLDPGRLVAALVGRGDLGQHQGLAGSDLGDDPLVGAVEDLVEGLPAG